MRTAWLSFVLGLLALTAMVVVPGGVGSVAAPAATATAPGRVQVEVRVLPTWTPPVTPITIPSGPTASPTATAFPTVTASPIPTASPSPTGEFPVVGPGGSPTGPGGSPTGPAAMPVGGGPMPVTGVSGSALAVRLALGVTAIVCGLALVLVARRRRDRTTG